MDELSTTWVYGEFRRNQDVYQEQLRIFDNYQATVNELYGKVNKLEKENAELKAKNQALHQRQFKANKKIESAIVKTKTKKRGAPEGHPAWTRPVPEKIDRHVNVPAPGICPNCGSENISLIQEKLQHIQEDIVIVKRPVVTKYIHDQAYCRKCRTKIHRPAPGELPNAPIGPVAKSIAIYLRYNVGVSYRKVQAILKDLFGLSCVPASLAGFDNKASSKALPLYDDLREKIRASDIVHADETSWRNDGLSHYVWYAGNDNLAFFQIDRHRSTEVALSIFGKDFSGKLIRDRYAAYNNIGEYQSCLAHIITRAKELKKEYSLLPDSKKEDHVLHFLENVGDFFSHACNIANCLKSGEIPWDESSKIEKRLMRKLGKICRSPLTFKPAETLRAYLVGPEQKNLFTFLRHPGVPPTNNQAEQSLRHMVIFRKISFGTRSASGIKNHSIIPSMIQTAKRQRVHPRTFLQTLLTADTITSQDALYNNSS
jgi:transposase